MQAKHHAAGTRVVRLPSVFLVLQTHPLPPTPLHHQPRILRAADAANVKYSCISRYFPPLRARGSLRGHLVRIAETLFFGVMIICGMHVRQNHLMQ